MTDDSEILCSIGKLLSLAPDSGSKAVISSYDHKVDHEVNIDLLKIHKVPVLTLCAQFLKIKTHSDEGTKLYLKDKLIDRIILAIESYQPAFCQSCNETYTIDIEGPAPEQYCYFCFQAAHPECNNSHSTERQLAGTVWLCHSCHSKTDYMYSDSTLNSSLLHNTQNLQENNPEPIEIDSSTNDETPAYTSSPSQQVSRNAPEQNNTSTINVEYQGHATTLQATQGNTGPDNDHMNLNISMDDISQDPIDISYQNDIVCNLYKVGKCPYGLSGKTPVNGEICKFSHPKKCRYYCRHGPYHRLGCKKGDRCTYFHPILCRYSVQKRECTNLDCTFTHLKYTRRYARQENQGGNIPPRYNRVNDPSDIRRHDSSYDAPRRSNNATQNTQQDRWIHNVRRQVQNDNYDNYSSTSDTHTHHNGENNPQSHIDPNVCEESNHKSRGNDYPLHHEHNTRTDERHWGNAEGNTTDHTERNNCNNDMSFLVKLVQHIKDDLSGQISSMKDSIKDIQLHAPPVQQTSNAPDLPNEMNSTIPPVINQLPVPQFPIMNNYPLAHHPLHYNNQPFQLPIQSQPTAPLPYVC